MKRRSIRKRSTAGSETNDGAVAAEKTEILERRKTSMQYTLWKRDNGTLWNTDIWHLNTWLSWEDQTQMTKEKTQPCACTVMEMRRDPRLFIELGQCYSIVQEAFSWDLWIFGLAVACCCTRFDDRMIEDSAAPASSETAMDEQNPCPSA